MEQFSVPPHHLHLEPQVSWRSDRQAGGGYPGWSCGESGGHQKALTPFSPHLFLWHCSGLGVRNRECPCLEERWVVWSPNKDTLPPPKKLLAVW